MVDQVSREQVLGALWVPWCWVATMGWSKRWWPRNQEDGWCVVIRLPTVDDVLSVSGLEGWRFR